MATVVSQPTPLIPNLADNHDWLPNTVRNPYGKDILLVGAGVTSLPAIRKKIENETGIKSDQQILVCHGRRIINDVDLRGKPNATMYIRPHPSLRPSHVSPGSKPRYQRSAFDTISLACPKGDMKNQFLLEIFVPAGKTIKTSVAYTTTTAELAFRIEERVGIPRWLQRLVHEGALVYSGQEAEDDDDYPSWTLDEIGVREVPHMWLLTASDS